MIPSKIKVNFVLFWFIELFMGWSLLDDRILPFFCLYMNRLHKYLSFCHKNSPYFNFFVLSGSLNGDSQQWRTIQFFRRMRLKAVTGMWQRLHKSEGSFKCVLLFSRREGLELFILPSPPYPKNPFRLNNIFYSCNNGRQSGKKGGWGVQFCVFKILGLGRHS